MREGSDWVWVIGLETIRRQGGVRWSREPLSIRLPGNKMLQVLEADIWIQVSVAVADEVGLRESWRPPNRQ